MDISKELELIEKKQVMHDSIIEEMMQKQLEIIKKIHLIKTLSVVDVIENMLRLNIFQEYNIDNIKIEFEYNYSNENPEIKYYLYNYGGEEIDNFNSSSNPIVPVEMLNSAFEKFGGFRMDNVSKEFRTQGVSWLIVEEGMGQKILNLLLSDELKISLQYSKLKVNFNSDFEIDNKIKRPKI